MSKTTSTTADIGLFDGAILRRAAGQAVLKLNPRGLARNPVIFVTGLTSVLVTILVIRDGLVHAPTFGIGLQIAIWLWFTVLFANFAEAIAEGRGKARADAFRATRVTTRAKVLADPRRRDIFHPKDAVPLDEGDVILVEAGDIVPTDGEVIEGVASVDESAITGESAPVIRESGGDRSSVTGGTRLVSDWLVVKVTARPGETFLDKMIALVEGAKRQKTPNEIALDILLAALTLVFLFVVVTLPFFALWSGTQIPVIYLAALFITLIPTTIGGLLSAIGIAGMDRLVKANVIAKSGRAVEAAGDIDVLLLDKTGTITFGNRMADAFMPLPGVTEKQLAEAAYLASLADETPEGKSIVELARQKFQPRGDAATGATFVPFTAQSRMSGANLSDGTAIRKGASDAILRHVSQAASPELDRIVRTHRLLRRHAAGGGRGQPHPRRHPSQGRGEAQHPRALRRAAQDGHPHRDGDRRQSADRRIDRRRGRRRRLPRRGDAGKKARADPHRAGRWPAGRDVRRRQQRRAGAGPGRCRRGDELRHAGRQGGRQPRRPRQRPDQAHRDRAGRQATADLARRADHLLDRQRRGEVLRHPAGAVRHRLSRASRCSTSWGSARRPRRSSAR